MSRDTIFALSSGRPPAAIAVVRISGPRAGDALRELIGRLPQSRIGTFARVRDGAGGDVIDEALVLWFPGPNSETGEDTAELQVHGGRAVIAAVLAALSRIDGLRMAEAGEFTRRAFENGRLDLTRVEGLADLIAADTEPQRRQALRQMRGFLGDKAEKWRKTLIETMALVEAQIDFPDEDDVPQDLLSRALREVAALRGDIAATLADGGRGERLREGLVIAIAGPPNAGKSSLLNRLARREAAIVSPFAGTTRDVIEVHLDLDGYPVTLLDTAGIRETDDPIEQEGVRRARERAAAADLVLWVIDATAGDGDIAAQQLTNGGQRSARPGSPSPAAAVPIGAPLGSDASAGASTVSSTDLLAASATPTWVIQNKIDLRPKIIIDNIDDPLSSIKYRVIPVSAKTTEGISGLIAELTRYAADYLGSTEPAAITRRRQRQTLTEALAALSRICTDEATDEADLVAEELRLAARALGRLTGRVDVDEVLEVIFRDFCIGK